MRRTWVYLAGGGALLLTGVVWNGLANRSGQPDIGAPILAAPTATLPAPVAHAPEAPQAATPETDGRLAAAEAEIGRLTDALAAATAENTELRTTLALRDAVLETLKASVAERDAALAGVRSRLASNEAELASLRGRLTGLQAPADFDRALTAMKLDAAGTSVARIEPVAITDGGFVAAAGLPASSLPAIGGSAGDGPVVEVQFDFASAALTPGGQERAAVAAAALSGMALAEVRVVGHTDRVGQPAANRRLAARRADAVARFLVDAGLPADLIVTDGAGETGAPVATEDGVAEPLNRSVLIFAQAKPTS